MEVWELQQRIRVLKERRKEYQNDIIKLKSRRERIKSEQNRKNRQKLHIANYYSKNRTNASILGVDIQGNAVHMVLGEYSEIFGTMKEENVFSSLEMVQYYLKKNEENINDKIEFAESNIVSIDRDIYCYKKQLIEMEREV